MVKLSGSLKGISAGAALALCLVATAAVAQDRPVTNRQDRADTVKINVSGRLAMDYLQRSDSMTAVGDAVAPGVAGDNSDSENTIEGEFGIRFDVDLTDKVSVQLEVGRSRIEESGNGNNQFTGLGASGVILREAHLMINEVFSPAIKAQLGISTWNFDVRGRGNSFAFDPRHSQVFGRAWSTSEDTLGATNSFGGRSDDAGELFPLGTVLTYARDALQIDLVLLPVIAEAGNVSQDEAMYAIDLWYNLDSIGKGSRLGMILALNSFGTGPGGATFDDETKVITIGLGGTLKFANGLELYGEAYFQTGKAGQQVGGSGEEAVSARGRAGQIGIEYRLPDNGNNIWLGAKITYLSGDNDSAAGGDERVDTFMSYENVRDTLIMEDQYYGFDLDSNYTAFKVMGGVSFSVGSGKNNLELSFILAFFRSTESYVDAATQEKENGLGNELDIKMAYHLNKQVDLLVNVGYLGTSDILEDATGGSANNDSDESAYLFSAGFDVRF